MKKINSFIKIKDTTYIITGFFIISFIIGRIIFKKYLIVFFSDVNIFHYFMILCITFGYFISVIICIYKVYIKKTEKKKTALLQKLFFFFRSFFNILLTSLKKISFFLLEKSTTYSLFILCFLNFVTKAAKNFDENYVAAFFIYILVFFKVMSVLCVCYDIFNEKIYFSQYILILGSITTIFKLLVHSANHALILLCKYYKKKEDLPHKIYIYEKVYNCFNEKMENKYFYINLFFNVILFVNFFTILSLIHSEIFI